MKLKKHEIRNTEHMILKALASDADKNSAVLYAFEKTKEFFAVYDIIENTNHADIIQAIYSPAKNRGNTLLHLSARLHISDRTLYRYRRKYMNCFIHYLNGDQGNSKAAA